MPSTEERDCMSWPLALDDVTASLEALADVLDEEVDFRALLRQVCRQVTRAVHGVDHATMTLMSSGGPETVAATAGHVVEVDLVQYATRGGPCLEAADTGHMVRLDIEEARQRWPDFAAAAAGAGMRSFLSAPLHVNGEFSGAINCYGSQQHGFAELDGHLLELYTTAVETALRVYRRYERARELADQLKTALETRAVIDQAKGILMAARGVSADEAFRLLTEKSQRANVKLRVVAEQFVADVSG